MKGGVMGPAVQQASAIAWHHVRRFASDRALLVLIAMALGIIYILGVTLQGLFSAEFKPARPFRVVVAFAVEEAAGAEAISETSAWERLAGEIAARLSQAPGFFAVQRAGGAEEARQAVLDRTADAAVVVRPGEPALTVIASPGSIAAMVLAEALQRFQTEGAQSVPAGASGPGDAPPFQNPPPEAGAGAAAGEPAAGGAAAMAPEMPWSGAGAFEYYAVAITVMFMAFAGHSAVIRIAEERATGAYLRIRAMGVSRATYFAASLAGALLIGFAFALALAVITRILFGVDWGDPGAWTLMTLFGALSIASLSFLILAVSPANPKSVENAGGTIYTILAFFGGSTVPLNVMPQWFAELFAWIPHRKMLDGYLSIVQGASAASLLPEYLGLGVASLVLLLLSWLVIRTFKKEEA